MFELLDFLRRQETVMKGLIPPDENDARDNGNVQQPSSDLIGHGI